MVHDVGAYSASVPGENPLIESCVHEQGKCNITKGLLLHVDAPVKQFIISKNETHNNAFVLNGYKSRMTIMSHLMSNIL